MSPEILRYMEAGHIPVLAPASHVSAFYGHKPFEDPRKSQGLCLERPVYGPVSIYGILQALHQKIVFLPAPVINKRGRFDHPPALSFTVTVLYRLMSYEVLEQLRRQLMLFKSPILDHPKTLLLFIPDML